MRSTMLTQYEVKSININGDNHAKLYNLLNKSDEFYKIFWKFENKQMSIFSRTKIFYDAVQMGCLKSVVTKII